MSMEKETLAGLVAIGLFLIGYLWYKSLTKPSSRLDEYYKEILTSEEYKVKGQFEE